MGVQGQHIDQLMAQNLKNGSKLRTAEEGDRVTLGPAGVKRVPDVKRAGEADTAEAWTPEAAARAP